MYKIIFLFFSMILFFYSCVNKENSNVEEEFTITINPKEIQKTDMGDIFDSIELIVLDNSDLALFKNCDKMLFFDGKFYLLDKQNTSILVFNKNGHFLQSSKHKEGEGPGEYYYISDFDFCDEEYIEILDVSAYKIRRYDLNFNFISEFALPTDIYPLNTFKRLSNGLYAFYSPYSNLYNQNDQIKTYSVPEKKIVYSMNGKLTDKSLKPHHTQNFSFYEVNSEVFFSFPYPDNNIYKIEKDGRNIEQLWKYNFGKYNLETSGNNPDAFNNIMDMSEKFAFPTNRYENEKCLFTIFLYNGNLNLNIYEKVTKESRNYSCEFKKNKMILPPNLLYKEAFYFVAEPDWLDHLVDKKLLDENSKRIFEGIAIDDNSVIIKYCLRK